MDKTSLGDRMKTYERVTRTSLMRRTPVIVRVDGKAFHTYTKRYLKDAIDLPFSSAMHRAMTFAARYVHTNMQNTVFSYTQSDEISFLLKDWNTHESEQWFNGSVQKIASVAASLTTAAFNYMFPQHAMADQTVTSEDLAHFDARVFNVPMDDVTNYFIWRQVDATRNSVQMLGRHYFSHKQLHKLNGSQIQEKLWQKHDVNWNELPTWCKRGACTVSIEKGNFGAFDRVQIDKEIPVFTTDRDYIERQLASEEE